MKFKKKAILIVLPIIIALVNINYNTFSTNPLGNEEFLEIRDETKLKTSGFWIEDPILIDDAATGVGAHNWTWAVGEDWCNGAGTWGNPYIIENVTIDGGNSTDCIHIKNSNVYFIIRNCTFYNSSSGKVYGGISLEDANNSRILNNNCSFNNGHGIRVYFSYNNTFFGNTASNNSENGIYIETAQNNTFSGNTLINNTAGAGIGGYTFYNNIISENTINNNGHGIFLGECTNNTVSRNIAINENMLGIYLHKSENNSIYGNTVNYNTMYGIVLEYSNFTLVYNNSFSGNVINAIDNSFYNDWNNSAIGNYWDDYDGKDIDGDGIGETPYAIGGSAGTFDYLPISSLDDVKPIITINWPSSGDFYGILAPSFNINVEEYHLDTTWYTIDGGLTNITFSGNDTINQVLWDNLAGETTVTIRFYANDTTGNIGFAEVTVIKDIISPQIEIYEPTLNEEFKSTPPNFNISIDESYLESTWYTIDGGVTNITFTGLIGSIEQNVWDTAPIGTVTLRFYARDLAGNEAFEEVTITKKTDKKPAIPGYPFNWILISVILIVFITLKNYKRKNYNVNI